MKRNVFLQGELGERFGQKFVVDCDALGDIFKCINANRPSFRSYLAECQEKGIDFSVEFQGETVDEESLLIPVEKGDVTVAVTRVALTVAVKSESASINGFKFVAVWLLLDVV